MGQVGHALLTRSPLSPASKACRIPFDLHVLSTPPAFVLSQNQTLHEKTMEEPNGSKIKKRRKNQTPCRTRGKAIALKPGRDQAHRHPRPNGAGPAPLAIK